MPLAESGAKSQKVRFGVGLRHSISSELEDMGLFRALMLSTPEQSRIALDLAGELGNRAAGVFSRAAMHTPVEVSEEALAHARSVEADCFVAVGGGSTTGLGKALALRTGLPQIVVPTTYAGSEATPILGQTENGVKTTLTDARILPDLIIYDPELAVTLPKELSATSGLNAMAHAAEALYARNRTVETTELALQGLRAFAKSLPEVLENPGNLSARENTLRGAWACGTVLGRVGMALHHKLCHTLGGSFDLPHAQTHAIVLPHAIAYNETAVPDLLAPIGRILGGGAPGRAIWDFSGSVGAPRMLKDLGMAESDLDRAADLATRNPYWNPRDVTPNGLRALLQNAWSGVAPGS